MIIRIDLISYIKTFAQGLPVGIPGRCFIAINLYVMRVAYLTLATLKRFLDYLSRL